MNWFLPLLECNEKSFFGAFELEIWRFTWNHWYNSICSSTFLALHFFCFSFLHGKKIFTELTHARTRFKLRGETRRKKRKTEKRKNFTHPREKLFMWRKPILRFMNQVKHEVLFRRSRMTPSDRRQSISREQRALRWERKRHTYIGLENEVISQKKYHKTMPLRRL